MWDCRAAIGSWGVSSNDVYVDHSCSVWQYNLNVGLCRSCICDWNGSVDVFHTHL